MTEQIERPRPFRYVLMHQCSGCGEIFDVDDLHQVQPDGHLACPDLACYDEHGDTELIEVECITVTVANLDKLLPARTPGSQLATEETGEAEVYINTLRFVVAPGDYTGRDVRHFMHPPLGDDHVLWMERVEGDEFIEDADTVTVKDGTKFYSAPRFINGG